MGGRRQLNTRIYITLSPRYPAILLYLAFANKPGRAC